jgi:hypothetical protein
MPFPRRFSFVAAALLLALAPGRLAAQFLLVPMDDEQRAMCDAAQGWMA